MDDKTELLLPDDFQNAAVQKQVEAFTFDKDVLDWIKGEHVDYERHINELLRFFMDTSRQREEDLQAQPEPVPGPGQGPKLGR